MSYIFKSMKVEKKKIIKDIITISIHCLEVELSFGLELCAHALNFKTLHGGASHGLIRLGKKQKVLQTKGYPFMKGLSTA